jgi:hypothetical protein
MWLDTRLGTRKEKEKAPETGAKDQGSTSPSPDVTSLATASRKAFE